MVLECPRSSTKLAEGMNFCPRCGTPQGGGAVPAAAPAPTMVPPGGDPMASPYPPVYPMPYMPSPFMYPAPITAKRAMAVAGGIMMIIAGGFLLIGSLVFFIDGQWMFGDRWLLLGIIDVLAFVLSLLGAVGIFRRSWPVLIVGSMTTLMVASIVSLYDLEAFGLMILVFCIVTIVLVAVAWSDMRIGRMSPYPPFQPFPMMPPMGPGVPPPGAAPPTGPGTSLTD